MAADKSTTDKNSFLKNVSFFTNRQEQNKALYKRMVFVTSTFLIHTIMMPIVIDVTQS